MKRSGFVRLAAIGLSLAFVLGCDPQHELPDTFPASGSVTHDGKPLASGMISFESPEDRAKGFPPASAPIVNGQYEIQAKQGAHLVRINAPVEKTDASGMTITEETIPAKYNLESELTAEVAPGAANTKDFALTGKVEKPKKPKP